jgi:hypothetical protein
MTHKEKRKAASDSVFSSEEEKPPVTTTKVVGERAQFVATLDLIPIVSGGNADIGIDFHMNS